MKVEFIIVQWIYRNNLNYLTLIFDMVKYLDFLFALDFLYRYYPKYHTNEMLLLADDILKWLNNELPEDSSALTYLKASFKSPYDAINLLWREISLLAGPFSRLN
ncbi:MAG TPA: hypothetical protein VD884_07660 [Ohtaekwangia sp.]|nr:hypothetical protein [Ohtaekwangia sp.]